MQYGLPGINLFSIINVFIYVALIIYVIYTFLILRQMQIMTSTFDLPGERVMKVFGIVHTLLVAGILFLALAIL